MHLHKTYSLFFLLFFAGLLPAQNDALWQASAKAEKAYTDKLNFVKSEQDLIVKEALQQQQRFERKLLRKLKKTNPKKYQEALAIVNERKAKLIAIKNKTEELGAIADVKSYVPMLDTVTSALNFIEKNKNMLDPSALKAMGQVQAVEEQFNTSAASIKSLNEYNERLQTAVAEVKGVTGLLDQYISPIKAYSEVLNDLRTVFKNPDAFEMKLMKYLRQIPGLDGFLSEHSEMAQNFPSSVSMNDPARMQNAAGMLENMMQGLASSNNNDPNSAGSSIANIQNKSMADIQQVINSNNTRPRRNYENVQQQVKDFKRPVKPYFNFAIRGYETWYPNLFDVQTGINIKNKYHILLLTYLNTRYELHYRNKLYTDAVLPSLAIELGKQIRRTFTFSGGALYNIYAFPFIRDNKEQAFKNNILLQNKNNSFTYFANASVKILQMGKASLNMGLRYEGYSKDPHSQLNINLGINFN
jgi:uncharacterized protein YfbU (UPF0304 family)